MSSAFGPYGGGGTGVDVESSGASVEDSVAELIESVDDVESCDCAELAVLEVLVDVVVNVVVVEVSPVVTETRWLSLPRRASTSAAPISTISAATSASARLGVIHSIACLRLYP